MGRSRGIAFTPDETRMVLEIFEQARLVTLGLVKPKRINKKQQTRKLLETFEQSTF